MEHELRCNNLSCRALLSTTSQTDSNAIVTTCSLTCAETIFTDARLCPACDSSLPEEDDIVYTSLNPAQTFRTTILAGMNPTIIQDICGRALGFWTYQVTQEIRLQETVLKDAKDRTAQMEKQMANVVREANSEISLISDKMQGLKEELDQVMRKNRELAESNRQHMKEYAKLKMQYEKVMSKSTLGSAFVKTGAATTIENSKGGPAQYPQIIHNAGLYPAMNQAGPNRIAPTPSRAFQPSGGRTRPPHAGQQTNALRTLNTNYNSNIQGLVPAPRSNVSSNGSNRGHPNGAGKVHQHGSTFAVEGRPFEVHPQGHSRHAAGATRSNPEGYRVDNYQQNGQYQQNHGGKFKIAMPPVGNSNG